MDKPENLNHRPKQTYQSLSYLYLYWPHFCFLNTPNLFFTYRHCNSCFLSPECFIFRFAHGRSQMLKIQGDPSMITYHHPHPRALSCTIVAACILVIYLLIIYVFSIHYNLSLVKKGTLLLFTIMLLGYKQCPAHKRFPIIIIFWINEWRMEGRKRRIKKGSIEIAVLEPTMD